MAVISNIFIDAGADFTTTVTVTDSTGSAVNLSGYSHAAQIRKSYDSAAATVASVDTGIKSVVKNACCSAAVMVYI